MSALGRLLANLAHAPALLVTVERTEGSVPREVGAWLALCGDELLGTIGGGQLEHQAIAEARALLAAAPFAGARQRRCALGPSLGQCCGGVVHLAYEWVTAVDAEVLRERLRTPAAALALFGGGHVGRAIVRLMDGLPFAVQWIDSRDAVFPPELPANVRTEHSEPAEAAVADLRAGSAVLIMSFSHAEDLRIVAACLARRRAQADLPFIGLIGSRTKWATFRHRLAARGFGADELDAVTCPIGLPGITGKQPAVVAVAVVAQLLGLPLPQVGRV